MTTVIARLAMLVLLHLTLGTSASAAGQQPYAPGKVVYDLSQFNPEALNNILDRASKLQNLYGNNPFEASIVIVVHEGAIPLFANRDRIESELIQRAASLALGEVIEFRLCRLSARMQGFREGDFPEFVNLVPMADAEIVRLQQAGYAYLR